jgi:hypothetical protein
MTKKEFYEKLFGEKLLNKDVITNLLSDIGRANSGGDDFRLDEDGIAIDIEEYVPCGRGCCGNWQTRTESISWAELVEDFFDDMERNHRWEKETCKPK